MTYVLTLLAAIAGATIGFGIGATVGTLLAPALGITSFEGASGYFAVFLCGPIGAVPGLIAGAVWMLRRRGVRSLGAVLGHFALTVAGVIAVAAAIFGYFYFSQDTLNPNGLPPRLAFEIRLPAGATAPGPRERSIELQTSKNRMPANAISVLPDRDSGRTVLSGSVEMYFRTSQRTLVMNMPDKTDVLFNIKLPAKPVHGKDFGAWQRADQIGEPGKDQARRATVSDNYEIRYRAVWAGED